MRLLRIKNWSEFQHYKDRNPPWIKLHRTLLDDYEFARLQDASKAHLMLIWLFASQLDGAIPEDARFIKRKLGLEKEPDLNSFIEHGFLIPEQVASSTLAPDASNLIHRDRDRDREDTRRKNGAVVTVPDWVPHESWDAWLEVRTKARAPNTARALNLALKELAVLRGQGHDPGTVLDRSTMNGWRGLFAPSKNSTPEPVKVDL